MQIAKRAITHSVIHAYSRGEHVAIDLAHFPTSEQGNCPARVMIDVCSRFVFLEAISDKTAATVVNRSFKLFCKFGFPKIIKDENGSEFANQTIAHLT